MFYLYKKIEKLLILILDHFHFFLLNFRKVIYTLTIFGIDYKSIFNNMY